MFHIKVYSYLYTYQFVHIKFTIILVTVRFIHNIKFTPFQKELELNKVMSKVGITYNLEGSISSILAYVIYLFT